METTQSTASLAALRKDRTLVELTLNPEQRSAQSLAPGLKNLLQNVGWRPNEVDLVAIVQGPGSFTGLRVGLVTAKMFAYAADADILGIDTMSVLAAAVSDEIHLLSVAIDAQRHQVIAGRFHRQPDGQMTLCAPAERIDVDRWLNTLPPGIAIIGPILPKLLDQIPKHVNLLDQSYWYPKAELVGRLAFRRYTDGQRDSIGDLTPYYSRKSAAEEKWLTDAT